jgi:hypothetical protein
MEVPCIVDSIVVKMGLVSEQNVTNHKGVRFKPAAQFQATTYPQVQDAECAGWIGRGGTRNWPPWSPDLNPLDYHVWGYMKAMVYAQKLNTREELLQRLLALQETSTTLQCFVRLQFLWSHESENASKQTENTWNNLLEC